MLLTTEMGLQRNLTSLMALSVGGPEVLSLSIHLNKSDVKLQDLEKELNVHMATKGLNLHQIADKISWRLV